MLKTASFCTEMCVNIAIHPVYTLIMQSKLKVGLYLNLPTLILFTAHTKLCEKRKKLLSTLPPEVAELTNKAECGICLEVIMERGKRFGLMSRFFYIIESSASYFISLAECDHSFCLTCIRAWRSKSKDATNASAMVKSCPTCRKESLFVIPSPGTHTKFELH